MKGHDGHQGDFTIIVTTLGKFKDRYDLTLTDFDAPRSQDEIIEPGEAAKHI